MMKYGKSISVEELFEPVLCALRCRWRRKQALLLLSLQTGEVAYWQNGEHSWQEQLNEECLADKQRLTDALREILLARDVEEGAAVLLLPAAATVYSEQLLLPLMHQRELQAALQWEVQQSVPWMHEDYTYSFEAHVIGEADEQQYQVMFAALQNASRAELEQLCRSLMLKLQGILLGSKTIDEAAENVYGDCTNGLDHVCLVKSMVVCAITAALMSTSRLSMKKRRCLIIMLWFFSCL